MTLRPLGDKVVIKQMEAEEKTKSGIVLPTQSKEKPQEAEVIAVGPVEWYMEKKLLCGLNQVTRLYIQNILEQKLKWTAKHTLLLNRLTF